MAGDWIKMEVALPDKPEVWRMAGVLSIDADSVVGKLLRVWAWFDSHTEDGNAVGVSYPLLDRVAGVAGFAEAMALVGWLEQNGHVLTLPKFGRHNGKTAKNRALTNERVAKSRTKQRDGNDESNADTVTDGVTKSVTREEKRREEKNTPNPQRGRTGAVTLKAWAESVKANGEKLIPADDPVFAYAEKVGLPSEFLDLAWPAFRHRYTTQHPAKRYSDWRRVFRNAVEGNWLKLWFAQPDGSYALTTVGIQAQRAVKDAA